jgi:hypothetical protein
MYKAVNREAVIISTKKAFRDWAKYIIPDSPVAHLYPDPDTDKWSTIYLIPELMDDEKAMEYVKKHHKKIFEEELSFWCAEEIQWPQSRTWKVFQEWFEINYQRCIRDTVMDPIRNY